MRLKATESWMSHAQVAMQRQCGPPMDMWSAGCILAELLLQEPLFPADSPSQLLSRVPPLLCTRLQPCSWQIRVTRPGERSSSRQTLHVSSAGSANVSQMVLLDRGLRQVILAMQIREVLGEEEAAQQRPKEAAASRATGSLVPRKVRTLC